MVIENLLGLTKSEIENLNQDNIISQNIMNGTIELKNVKSGIDGDFHNVLFYFDLTDRSTMTMAVLKFEEMNIATRAKLFLKKEFKCNDYIGKVTYSDNKKEAVIAYVHKNIVKSV